MATRKPATAPEDLLAQLSALTDATTTTTAASTDASSASTSTNAQPKQQPANPPPPATAEAAIFAELDHLAHDRPHSRQSSLPSRAVATSTPPPLPSASSSSATQARRSGEGTRAFHEGLTPIAAAADNSSTSGADKGKGREQDIEAVAAAGSGASWWGGLVATASAAVKQAEAIAKEIRENEEAQRWAEQVKGNVGALRGLGGELRSRALPTFANILHTLAPPISSHERLQIHITHDLVGYPSLDPLIYGTFSRIMAQVEGGDLLVVQRGHEASPRRVSGTATDLATGTAAGWSDGPWWRHEAARNLGAVAGLVEGTKLARASAESYAAESLAAKAGSDEATRRAAEPSEDNPTRTSDIFLAVQAITSTEPSDLFGAAATNTSSSSPADAAPSTSVLSFAVYLLDPAHSIAFHTVSQALPDQWLSWLDRTADSALPAEIADAVTGGGVDPREWVAEWVEEVLTLAVGVVAQRYVARRMGVGEGVVGREAETLARAKVAVVDEGAGELARAM